MKGVLTPERPGHSLPDGQQTRTAQRGHTVSEGRAHHDTLQRGSLVRRVLPSAIVTRAVPAWLRVAVVAALAIGFVPAACEAGTGDAVPCCPDPARFWLRCSLESRSPDSVRLRLRDTVRTFPLGTVELQNAAAALRQKNRALASFAVPPSSGKLEALAVEVHWSIRLAVILGAVAVLLPLARTYRKSDVQERAPAGLMLAWFVVLAAAYVCTVVLRWWAGGFAYTGGVQVPANPVVLAGVSALTFGGARASRIWKERLGLAAPDARAVPAADVASLDVEHVPERKL